MPLFRHTPECVAAAREWPPVERDARPQRRDGRTSIPVFEWQWFERYVARTHPITPLLWFGPFIGAGVLSIARGFGPGRLAGLAWFVGGWLTWSLFEYLLHRFLFHMGASTPAERMRAFLVHGYHHVYPNDPMRLVAPPLMSWPLGTAIAVGEYYVVGPHVWLSIFAGTSAGYLAYDWIHYYAHHFRPQNRLGKWLRSYHMMHHHEDGDSRFGISSPLWDFVFRTYRPLRSGARAVEAIGR